MTLRRPPLSLDAAIACIMSQLGSWAEVAAVTGYAPRTCEKWGAFDIADPEDPDARDIPMRAARKLDIAYQAAGGIGAPILEAYADQVKVAASEQFGDKHDLQTVAIELIRENSEAETAALEAAAPGAGPLEAEHAQRELLQSRRKIDNLLPLLARLASLGRKPP